jgi:hypothetical protein
MEQSMKPTPGLVLPSYYTYHTRPVKLVETHDGGVRAWALDWTTGGWVRANELIDEILFAVGGDTFRLTPEDFIDAVEFQRGRRVKGDGPVFALYETADAIGASAEKQNRRLTADNISLVKGLRRKTYRMFEEELQRQGDPGADPDLLDGQC